MSEQDCAGLAAKKRKVSSVNVNIKYFLVTQNFSLVFTACGKAGPLKCIYSPNGRQIWIISKGLGLVSVYCSNS